MRLSKALKLIRANEDLTLRDLAKEIDISPATLSRIERGFPCEMETFWRLITWLKSPQTRKDIAA